MTQWGKIKKSESNDGKTVSELLETGAWEGMVADTVAKKRETKVRVLMEPQISNMLQHDKNSFCAFMYHNTCRRVKIDAKKHIKSRG